MAKVKKKAVKPKIKAKKSTAHSTQSGTFAPARKFSLVLETPIDKMMEIVEEKKSASFKYLAKELSYSVQSIEKIGKVLERHGLVDVQYPTLLTQQPRIKFISALPAESRPGVQGEIVSGRAFAVDFVPARSLIIQKPGEQRYFYKLETPRFGPYTKIFLEELKDRIAEKVPVEISEITDSKKSKELKQRFFVKAREELETYLGEGNTHTKNTLAGLLLHSMYGLGEIEVLMADDQLEEVAINSSKSPVTIYHKEHGWMKTNIFMGSENDIGNYASQIGRKVGREITNLNPLLDAHLVSGDRVAATLSPISTLGNTITIRRFSRKPWTITDLIGKSGTMSVEMASLLWLAMHYEMSILIAGGTASGKTSTLNALLAFIPSYHRIISIEDVREIMLPSHLIWNWVPTNTRNPNPEGMGEVTMLDLMQASLRMRPDRIILGEVRRKKEAEVLFEAMHTGHSVYSTIHANSGEQVLRRLIEPPISLPPLEIEGMDLIVVQYRDRKTNKRRTYEIAEIEGGGARGGLSINTIYKWNARDDSFEAMNPASKLVGNLNMHTGMTEKEIAKDLEQRATILQWMLDEEINDIDSVGTIMTEFYSNPEMLLKAIKAKRSKSDVLEV